MIFNLCLVIICILYISVISDCSELEQKIDCTQLRLNDGGDVITTSDSSYNSIRLDQGAVQWSTIEDRDAILSPTIITIPRSENDILSIIEFANKCDYTISIRSGGHQYSGLSSCDGSKNKCIQIDMKYFDDIEYIDDDNSIIVGSGVKLVDLYTANNEKDIAILGGTCPTVAAGGIFQSSSQSVWTRSLGLGMDYIIRIKLITASGEIRNLYKNTNDNEEMDLFWAVLGGSPGSWGVVIEYEFEPIKNSDYPYSYVYSSGHLYTKEGFSAFFTQFINLLNNPYYSNYNDMTVYMAGFPLLTDTNSSSSTVGTFMNTFLMWTGSDNDDIHGMIPDHPLNKTWHQELVQPFIDIDELFKLTQVNDSSFEGAVSISGWLYGKSDTGGRTILPPFRRLEVSHQYNKTKTNQLFNDKLKTKQWIQSIVDIFDELASNSTDNIEILWQFWDLFSNEGAISDDLYISYDPLKNYVSFPLRSMGIQSDNVVLFGDGDSYSDDVLFRAKQYQNELKQILTENFVKSDLKSYAYTDLIADEYDLNKQFNEFYNYRSDIYQKLKDIKTLVDENNIFYGPLTIPTNSQRDYVVKTLVDEITRKF